MRRLLTSLTLIFGLGLSTSAIAGSDTVDITPTSAQVLSVGDKSPQDVTITLNREQVSIIVHNFPKVDSTKLTLDKGDIGRGDVVNVNVDERGARAIPMPQRGTR